MKKKKNFKDLCTLHFALTAEKKFYQEKTKAQTKIMEFQPSYEGYKMSKHLHTYVHGMYASDIYDDRDVHLKAYCSSQDTNGYHLQD